MGKRATWGHEVIASASPAVRALNPSAFPGAAIDAAPAVDGPPPLRRGRKMNKTEARWGDALAADPAVKRAVFEGVTLRLGDGVRYSPDFAVFYVDGTIGLDEVKGAFIRPDALTKLRVAVSAFPEFRWRLVQWKRREWRISRDVRP